MALLWDALATRDVKLLSHSLKKRFNLPPMEGAGSTAAAMGAILSGVANGDLTPGEASSLAGLVDAYRKAFETTELEARLKALEEKRARLSYGGLSGSKPSMAAEVPASI